MRVLNERLQGRELDLLDGIKVFDERGWAQVLPDPDEPLMHLYAEGETTDDVGGARGRAARRSSRRSCRETRLGREPGESLKLRLTLRVRAALLETHRTPTERRLWNRFPTRHALRRRARTLIDD